MKMNNELTRVEIVYKLINKIHENEELRTKMLKNILPMLINRLSKDDMLQFCYLFCRNDKYKKYIQSDLIVNQFVIEVNKKLIDTIKSIISGAIL